jgi:hypothetical protein
VLLLLLFYNFVEGQLAADALRSGEGWKWRVLGTFVRVSLLLTLYRVGKVGSGEEVNSKNKSKIVFFLKTKWLTSMKGILYKIIISEYM